MQPWRIPSDVIGITEPVGTVEPVDMAGEVDQVETDARGPQSGRSTPLEEWHTDILFAKPETPIRSGRCRGWRSRLGRRRSVAHTGDITTIAELIEIADPVRRWRDHHVEADAERRNLEGRRYDIPFAKPGARCCSMTGGASSPGLMTRRCGCGMRQPAGRSDRP
jgi:hypothetical protein